MLTEFEMSGYRKFDNLLLKNLKRINIFLGDNNTGKTSVLEAIYMWCNGKSLYPTLQYGVNRRFLRNPTNPYEIVEAILAIVNENYAKKSEYPINLKAQYNGKTVEFLHKIVPGPLFFDMNESMHDVYGYQNVNNDMIYKMDKMPYQINTAIGNTQNSYIAKWDIETNITEKIEYDLVFPYQYNSNIPAYALAKFVDMFDYKNTSELARILTVLKRTNKIESFINDINKMYGDIAGFDLLRLHSYGTDTVFVKNSSNEYLPINSYGDGLQRSYSILGNFVLYPKAIICIDEIDTTLHYTTLNLFNNLILKYSKKYNNQLFLTSHNKEWLDSFLSCAEKMKSLDEINVFRLNNKKNINISGTKAIELRNEFGMELR